MKTFAFGLLFSLICSIASAQYHSYGSPYHPQVVWAKHNYRDGSSITFQQADSLERFSRQLYWDNYRFRSMLYSSGKPSPHTIDYSKYPNYQPTYRKGPFVREKGLPSTYEPNLKVYSKKNEIKLPKAKPGKPGELPKAHGNN